MAQTEEFIFQNVAYRPTVYRTGPKSSANETHISPVGISPHSSSHILSSGPLSCVLLNSEILSPSGQRQYCIPSILFGKHLLFFSKIQNRIFYLAHVIQQPNF